MLLSFIARRWVGRHADSIMIFHGGSRYFLLLQISVMLSGNQLIVYVSPRVCFIIVVTSIITHLFVIVICDDSLMHQSFVSTTPLGPGNSGAFYFSNFKALVKAPPCGAKDLVKSLLNALALRGLAIMRNDK